MGLAPWMIYSPPPERAFALQVDRLALKDLSHAELLALADHLTLRDAIQDQLLSQAVGRVMELECVLGADLQQRQLGNRLPWWRVIIDYLR
jgi:hypothetical protein